MKTVGNENDYVLRKNERLEEQAEGIDSLTTHQLEAEALLSIAREKGGS